MRWFLVLAVCLLPAVAQAGAWARDKGSLYLSVTGYASDSGQAEGSIYAEYGLTERLTLGAKVFGGPDTSTEALVFLTTAFRRDKRIKLAFSTGVGAEQPADGGDILGLGQLGLHAGMGLPRGWLALDVYATLTADLANTTELPDPDYKADLTFGHRLSDRWSLIAQLQGGKDAGGEAYLKAAPSVGLSVGRADLQLGVVWGVTNDDSRKIALGTSLRF